MAQTSTERIMHTMAGYKAVEMNSESEYAQTLGIEKGDILLLEGLINAKEGDLLLVELKDGRHELDTYEEAYTDLEAGAIGVLIGCVKLFKDAAVSGADTDNPEDVLNAAIIE